MKTLSLALTTVACMICITGRSQVVQFLKDENIFQHLDVSVTTGTTGFGFELGTNIGDYVKLKSGLSFVPRFEVPMEFDIQVGDDPRTSKSKFDQLSTKLSSITGNKVEQEVNMIGKPKFWNWSLMADVYPFKNKHWHVTAGFYLGPSKIAEAYNATESMSTLLAVDIYNNLYNRVAESPVLNDPLYFFNNNVAQVIQNIGILRDMGLADDLFENLSEYPQLSETYFDIEDNAVKRTYQKIYNNGRMGVKMGKYARDIVDESGNVIHKKGETYLMEPDNNSMVKASMYVNSFKPFLGFGYEGRLIKGDDRYHISVDGGIMFWGGTPRLETHDGTDLINDVEDVPGKVGDYIQTIDKLKVFPVLNVKVTRTIF